MIVGSYLGPATVVLPDGTVFPVVAYLHSAEAAGLQLWRGDLTAEDEQALWNTMRVGHGSLRLPDGREGVFTAVRVEGLAGEQLRINGSGPAPF